ncbi:MAG: hypothetical protein ACFFDC_19400, partial [Promethearchaeota archaeon]
CMEHHTIHYEFKKSIVLALVTSEKKISKRKISTIMRRIHNNFIEQYHKFFEQDCIEPNLFRDFSSRIDSILQTSGVMSLDRSSIQKTVSSAH